MYKQYAASIEGHFDREVKKRGCERLHWDASYKEAKHLSQYHGHNIFKALITGTNERGEIRVRFHVVTDGHDQLKRPHAPLQHRPAERGRHLFQARNRVASGQAGRA